MYICMRNCLCIVACVRPQDWRDNVCASVRVGVPSDAHAWWRMRMSATVYFICVR